MGPWKPLAVVCALSLSPFALLRAEDGDLDTSFSGDGKVTVAFDLGQSNHDFGNAVSQTPGGHVVIAGSVERSIAGDFDFGLVQLDPDGTPDSGFSGDGHTQVFFDLGGDKADAAHSVVAMKDGRVVTCGTARYFVPPSGEPDRLVVSRNLADGGVDLSFGNADGRVVLNPFDLDDSDALDCESFVVLDDNRIVLPFTLWNHHLAGLIRLEEDGDLDPTFGGDGISEMPSCSTDLDACELRRVVVLPNGKYLALGTKTVEIAENLYANHLFFARYSDTGFLDNSFSGDGLATLHAPNKDAFSDSPDQAAVDHAGRVLVVDHVFTFKSSYDLLTRITSSGAADTNFGVAGWSQLELRNPPAADQEVNGLLVQGDGKIIVTGNYQFSGLDYDCAAMRLNASGTALDTSFDGDGRASIAFDLGTATSDTDACQGASASDGRPLLAGSIRVGDDYDFGATRLVNSYIYIDGFESSTPFFWSARVP